MKNTVFEYRDYRSFLKDALEQLSPARGARSRLAEALGCQTAFISQVLAGKVHFSLEHAIRIGSFLGLGSDENHFLILLVHLGRAGSLALREYYEKQIDVIIENRQLISERIQAKGSLSLDDQVTYYSSWCFSTLHVALSLQGPKTAERLAARVGIPVGLAQQCLEFLVTAGLANRQGLEYEIGARRIHLGRESPLISRHHTNWRMKAIASLDSPQKSDLHYSGVFTLTRSDFKRIRELLLDALEESEPILRNSKEESIAALCMDWFAV